ncbi:hypothetical protein ROZALSC1DRAFT_30563, partial [Rozella allomycis CSF55]
MRLQIRHRKSWTSCFENDHAPSDKVLSRTDNDDAAILSCVPAQLNTFQIYIDHFPL